MKQRRQALQSGEPAPAFLPFLVLLLIVAVLTAELGGLIATGVQVRLPGTTFVEHMRPIELVVLLAIQSAVTLAWWRHRRRDIASPRRIGRRV